MGRGCTPRSDPVTLGGIFRELGPLFLTNTPLGPRQRQAFRAIAQCRTPALGGAVWTCAACGHRVGVYHSCRDRHCPQCQAGARFRWVGGRLSEVLPVPYFHTVFTLPHELNPLIRANLKVLIGCLFRAVSQTLTTFAADPKHLGAEPGLILVLHTWGRKLDYHVHIHCIVTGGGLSADGRRWIAARNRNYLFPVRAVSKVFRAKYLDQVSRQVAEGKVFEVGPDRRPLDGPAWRNIAKPLCRKDWVVYAKRPFGGPAQVIKYLGAYTHRVAIANNRLVRHENGMVRFRYKDYKHGGKIRILTLPEDVFAKRFLQHVLPRGLVRIRYGGFLANCKKKRSLEKCRELLGEAKVELEDLREPGVEADGAVEDIRPCPVCGAQALILTDPITVEEVEAARQNWLDSS